jgi:amidase
MLPDSGILLSAMSGEDKNDPATKNNPKNKKYLDNLKTGNHQKDWWVNKNF